jgi:hypothetical protein
MYPILGIYVTKNITLTPHDRFFHRPLSDPRCGFNMVSRVEFPPSGLHAPYGFISTFLKAIVHAKP